jgi:hypothetical protein
MHLSFDHHTKPSTRRERLIQKMSAINLERAALKEHRAAVMKQRYVLGLKDVALQESAIDIRMQLEEVSRALDPGSSPERERLLQKGRKIHNDRAAVKDQKAVLKTQQYSLELKDTALQRSAIETGMELEDQSK